MSHAKHFHAVFHVIFPVTQKLGRYPACSCAMPLFCRWKRKWDLGKRCRSRHTNQALCPTLGGPITLQPRNHHPQNWAAQTWHRYMHLHTWQQWSCWSWAGLTLKFSPFWPQRLCVLSAHYWILLYVAAYHRSCGHYPPPHPTRHRKEQAQFLILDNREVSCDNNSPRIWREFVLGCSDLEVKIIRPTLFLSCRVLVSVSTFSSSLWSCNLEERLL